MKLAAGAELQGGKFRIVRDLGSGGFGNTYEATQILVRRPSLETRTVVIKEYFPREIVHRDSTSPALILNEEARPDFDSGLKKFVREGRILLDVTHPNIVRVYELFEEGDTAYLVMENITGGDLATALKEAGGRFDEARTRLIFSGIISALETLHHHDPPVFHLDIKPQNVMLRPDGRPVLIDFGAARLGQHTTQSGYAFTLNYAPPELMSFGRPGPESDLYELGVLLHLVLTGNLPPNAMARSQRSDSVFWTPGLPEPWRTLVTQALDLEQSTRPNDVRSWWHQATLEVAPWNATSPTDPTPPPSGRAQNRPALPAVPSWVQRGMSALGLGNILAPAQSSGAKDTRPNNPAGAPVTASSIDGAKLTGLPAPVLPPATPRTKTNPIDGAEMVWIPDGSFMMGSRDDGSPESDPDAQTNEKPQRVVFLSGYWLYKHPVTVAQFRKFVRSEGYNYDWNRHKPSWGWQDDHPMVGVTWEDAHAYCEWVGGNLPTEAQWEKAARGTDGRRYPWGDTFDDTRLWCSVNTPRSGTALVYRSGNRSASPFGCMDMAGNVWQWCQDWYAEDYYGSAPTRDPSGPSRGSRRSLRGGSWNYSNPDIFRVTLRDWGEPTLRAFDLGFRVCLPGL